MFKKAIRRILNLSFTDSCKSYFIGESNLVYIFLRLVKQNLTAVNTLNILVIFNDLLKIYITLWRLVPCNLGFC